MSLKELKEMSNKYGANSEYVLAGGGNTSFKDEKYIYVKSSGVSLANITEDGFVKMEKSALNQIFSKVYSSNDEQREAQVLADMLSARCAGEQHKRPSVEAVLHLAMPFKFVLHIHPSMVNGMTCGKDGKAIFSKLFSKGIWIEPIMPGYILALTVKNLINEYNKANGEPPKLIFLENHGVFIGGNNLIEIDELVVEINEKLKRVIISEPNLSKIEFNRELAVLIAPAIRCLLSSESLGTVFFCTNNEVMKVVSSVNEFYKVSPAFTPDHMVYCNDKTLFIESGSIEEIYPELEAKIKEYEKQNSKKPKIIGFKNLGYFACGNTKKEADIASKVFLDAIKVNCYAKSFGGSKEMPKPLVLAINNWEVERYRKSVSFSSSGKKTMLQEQFSM